tara:strand:- start:805 stop:1020 length:216 start_codon:yes stop_codon:yes gene_type:complete
MVSPANRIGSFERKNPNIENGSKATQIVDFPFSLPMIMGITKAKTNPEITAINISDYLMSLFNESPKYKKL